jgi:hypothetical protein
MSSKNNIGKLVVALSEAFGRTATETTIDAFYLGLQDIPDEALNVGFMKCLHTCKFMPSVAEIRENCGVTSTNDRAVLAWDVVLKNHPRGPWEHVDFDDGAINATIRNMGGWPEFYYSFTSVEAEKWVRKTFIDTYRSLSHAGVDGEICKPLMGLSEVPGKKPVRIATGLPLIAAPLAIGQDMPKITFQRTT